MHRKPLRDEVKELEIYIILSSISDEFYVWKTKQPNHYQVYKDHARLKYARTRDLFIRSQEAHTFPKMYLLETIHATETKAFCHCVAWTRYFLEQGYSPLATPTILDYANHLNEDSQTIYDKIRHHSIEDIIQEKQLLVSSFTPQKTNIKSKNKITFIVSEQEYETIQKRAENIGFTMSRYCKNMALNGRITRFSLTDYLTEIREIKQVLQEIQLAIYQNGRYYPADLENIQQLVHDINKQQRKLLRAVTKEIKEWKSHPSEKENSKTRLKNDI